MELNSRLDEKHKEQNLGGFPPIYKISTTEKKKREFNKTIEPVNKNVFHNLNILNVKNILGLKN
jgi:hypothetical protein